jgi:SAM-dependent methyltransferase
MKEKVFDKVYAEQYDLLYGEKEYEAECDLLEEAFRRYATGKVHTILDLGCGTGSHAIPLAQRGYAVTGVDLSEDMLTHARQKAQALPTDVQPPTFLQGDARSVDADQTFDAVLMMFAVLGYQLENKDVSAALRTVHKHLRPGGMFIFDVWYGPAVLAIRPSERVKVIPVEGGQLIRAASGSLDTFRHLSEVHYHLWRIQDQKLISETEEHHLMRYFFPQELAYFLDQAGLELKGLTSFPSLDQPASETSWNVVGVASTKYCQI